MTDAHATPLLTARETARYLQIPESTLGAWLAGALVHAVEPERRGRPRVPFVGVVEAYVLRTLRTAGLSMDDVRRAAEIVRAEFGDPYALASPRIATDGARLFVRLADESVLDAHDDQLTLPVIEGSLRNISWDPSGRATSLRLPQYPPDVAVVIDPRFASGAPVLAESKVPVAALTGRWRAGASIGAVAEEFGLTAYQVEAVLRQAA